MSGPETTPAPAPAPAGPMADITEATVQFVVRAFSVTICTVLVMIVAVLCMRVLADGNAPIVNQITSDLASIVPWLLGALVAAIVGTKGIAAFLAR